MVTLITLALNPVRPDSSVGRASGICPVGPGFNPQSGHLSVLTEPTTHVIKAHFYAR